MIEYLAQHIPPHVANALCWTIIHSLWQGSLVALMMSYYLNKYEHEPSMVRYRIAGAALFFVLLFSIGTFIYYLWSHFAHGQVMHIHVQEPLHAVSISQDISHISLSQFFGQYSDMIAYAWILGMILFSSKYVLSLAYTQYLRNTAREVFNGDVLEVLWDVKAQLKIQKDIILSESSKITSPILIGCIKPMIIFPIGVLNQLSLDEVESILAHELTHVFRNDYLQNAIQSIVEILFYYHPAVWWISANIRAERENCCDEVAVNVCGNPVAYVKVLVKLEELQTQRMPSLAMYFSKKKLLLERAARILNQPQNQRHTAEKLITTVCLVFALFSFGISQQASQTSHSVDLNITGSSSENPSRELFIVPTPPPPTPPASRCRPCDDKRKNRRAGLTKLEVGSDDARINLNKQKEEHNIIETIPSYGWDLSSNGKFAEMKQKHADIISELRDYNRSDTYSWSEVSDYLDTLPRLDPHHDMDMHLNNDEGGRLRLKIRNGEVQEFKLNGKKVDPEDYGKYIELSESGQVHILDDRFEMPEIPPMPELPEFGEWGEKFAKISEKMAEVEFPVFEDVVFEMPTPPTPPRLPGFTFSDEEVELYQNEPNPFRGSTVISFYHPSGGVVKLTFFGIEGNLIKQIQKRYPKGRTNIDVDSKDLGITGPVYYQLESGDFSTTRKMTILE